MEIYTDGYCRTYKKTRSTGFGGWGFVHVEDGQVVRQGSGGALATTNGRMELEAIIQGLLALAPEQRASVTIISDSRYVMNVLKNNWYEVWSKRRWLAGSTAHQVKNLDLWHTLAKIITILFPDISYTLIKAHTGHKFNDLADKLAADASMAMVLTDEPAFFEVRRKLRREMRRKNYGFSLVSNPNRWRNKT